MGRALILRQIGYALIAVGLIFLTLIGTTPQLFPSWLGFYSFFLVAAGGISVVLFKCIEIIQYSQLRKRSAYCGLCGWFGRGDTWYRSRGCPECDSVEVMLR